MNDTSNSIIIEKKITMRQNHIKKIIVNNECNIDKITNIKSKTPNRPKIMLNISENAFYQNAIIRYHNGRGSYSRKGKSNIGINTLKLPLMLSHNSNKSENIVSKQKYSIEITPFMKEDRKNSLSVPKYYNKFKTKEILSKLKYKLTIKDLDNINPENY